MRTFEYKLMTDGDMSDDLTSDAQSLEQIYMCCIQAVWTGATAAGSLYLQITNDGTNWTTYSGSTTTVAGAGNFAWNLMTTPFKSIRVFYDATSGTGTLNITVNGKGA